jgi:hypothetical protein
LGLFERVTPAIAVSGNAATAGGAVRVDVAARLRATWAMPPRQDLVDTT